MNKILYIAPNFFGYESDVYKELISRNLDVEFLPDRPFKSTFMIALAKLNPQLMGYLADIFYFHALKRVGSTYDFIFIMEGQTVSDRILGYLRKNNKKSKIVLYLSDSVMNKPDIALKFPMYDYIFTFDSGDANKYKLIHRPLFFANEFKATKSNKYKYMFSFVGTVHSDRYIILQKLLSAIGPVDKSFVFLYIKSYWLYFYYKLTNKSLRNSNIKDFNFTALSRANFEEILKDSFAIIDIEHPYQSGLTIRTLQALGANRKLITTNKSIVNYNFFDKNNILLIDRNSIKIPVDFFSTPYNPVPEIIYLNYSIKNWLDEIFQKSEFIY